MSAQSQEPMAAAETIAARIDHGVHLLAGHWLVIFNLLVALYLGLALAAPVLMHGGHDGSARVLYLIFKTQCHQLPERSLFLYGEKATYSLAELSAAGVLPGPDLNERAAYVGDEHFGYKVAFCQRDVATWGAILLAGLLYGLTRKKWRPLPLWAWALCLSPMAADGITQLVGLRESSWPLRISTGAVFGLASVWLAYPYVERGMCGIQRGGATRPSTRSSADLDIDG